MAATRRFCSGSRNPVDGALTDERLGLLGMVRSLSQRRQTSSLLEIDLRQATKLPRSELSRQDGRGAVDPFRRDRAGFPVR